MAIPQQYFSHSVICLSIKTYLTVSSYFLSAILLLFSLCFLHVPSFHGVGLSSFYKYGICICCYACCRLFLWPSFRCPWLMRYGCHAFLSSIQLCFEMLSLAWACGGCKTHGCSNTSNLTQKRHLSTRLETRQDIESISRDRKATKTKKTGSTRMT
jgi:hypothetical protein